jgi:hypothetical protein
MMPEITVPVVHTGIRRRDLSSSRALLYKESKFDVGLEELMSVTLSPGFTY